MIVVNNNCFDKLLHMGVKMSGGNTKDPDNLIHSYAKANPSCTVEIINKGRIYRRYTDLVQLQIIKGVTRCCLGQDQYKYVLSCIRSSDMSVAESFNLPYGNMTIDMNLFDENEIKVRYIIDIEEEKEPEYDTFGKVYDAVEGKYSQGHIICTPKLGPDIYGKYMNTIAFIPLDEKTARSKLIIINNCDEKTDLTIPRLLEPHWSYVFNSGKDYNDIIRDAPIDVEEIDNSFNIINRYKIIDINHDQGLVIEKL